MGHCSCNHCHTERKRKISPYLLPAISFGMLLGGIAMQVAEAGFFDPTVRFIWYALAYLPVGLPVMKEAIESIREKEIFSEFTLMCIATLGAFYIGEYPEGVAVMLFYSVGELFQENALSKARKNISALLDVRPETAVVIRDNERVPLAPADVIPGEIIEVKAGERVPLDGKLLSGAASFNTAALTGESVPRTISPNENVLAGMIVTDKVIRLEVTKPYNQSALARILELVQNASERKAPAELFIRKFARIYTPIVTGLAFLIVLIPYLYSLVQPDFLFIFNDWLYRALVFLVISCPCALVISIPLGYFGGIGAASRQGILFKGGNYLDAITKINTVVFDKTGTLTKGVFEVRSLSTENNVPEKELLRIIASVESRSNHPIAKAILAYAQEQQVTIDTTIDTTELPGYGLKAIVDGKEVLVGNPRLLDSEGVLFPPKETNVSPYRNKCFIRKKQSLCRTLVDVLYRLMYSSLADNKECFILQCIRQVHATKLQATEPSGHLFRLQGIKYLAELINGLLFILISLQPPETIQFLVIIIFNLFAHGSQQTVTFTSLMLATTLFGNFTRFRYLADLPAF